MLPLFAISTPALATHEELGLATEWLETNGLGDFASSTLWMCPTRRYHAWLVTRPEQSEKRYVMFSRFTEQLEHDAERCTLTHSLHAEGPGPRGARNLERFQLNPHPESTYRSGALSLRREIQMLRGQKATLVRYTNPCESPLELRLRPELPCREADALTMQNAALRSEVHRHPDGLSARPYDALPALHFTLSCAWSFEADARWELGLELPVDRARGYDHREDHFSPGEFLIELMPGASVVIAVSIEARVADPAGAWARETERRLELLRAIQARSPSPKALRLDWGAEDFFTRIDGRAGIDAGFPWFGEWGRDTFIALPGLTLARADMTLCEEVLSQSLGFLQDGLLPNIFGLSKATSHYGSVDAALWYGRAVQLYDAAGGSEARLADEYLPALLEIANHYWNGTGLGIVVDAAGLIQAGSAALNATWMDAMLPSGPVTPRAGCAVEINALWYSLLMHVETLTAKFGERKTHRLWKQRRKLAGASFLERFWLPDQEHLADLWSSAGVDARVRPNMVLAAALELSPMTKAQRLGVVRCAEEQLLTNHGLRTLASAERAYRGRFRGNPEERDTAYHQGTVWPWLFGFHVEAALRAGDRAALPGLRARWEAIVSEIDRAGLNHISEVFDGDEPREPGGSIAQAWNTAELLRADRLMQGALSR